MSILNNEESITYVDGGCIPSYGVCIHGDSIQTHSFTSVLTKEDNLKRVEEFIEKYTIESDEKSIYL